MNTDQLVQFGMDEISRRETVALERRLRKAKQATLEGFDFNAGSVTLLGG